MPKRYVIVLLSILFLHGNLHPQTNPKDFPGIESFKTWLKKSWLKDHMSFDSIEVYEGKTLLILRLDCNNNCSGKWAKMKASFDSLSSISLEEFLWTKVDFHLEGTRHPLIVDIYNKTNGTEIPCFYRGISYSDFLKVDTSNCKDLGSEATLSYLKFHPEFMMKKRSKQTVDKNSSQILDTIFSRSEAMFLSKGAKVIKTRSLPYRLEFEVQNLKNEVIKKNSYEKLRFIIKCSFQTDHVRFETMVHGKTGSLVFKPISDKGYNDMEDDHRAEFQTYVHEFTNQKIIQWLK